MAAFQAVGQRFKSPYPLCPFGTTYSSIAQLVEQVTVNHPVPGSSPGGGPGSLTQW